MNGVAESEAVQPCKGDALSTEARQLCEILRTARLTQKYYGHQLVKYRTWNALLEFGLALGTSSALAGFVISDAPTTVGLWRGVVGISVLIAITKPILNLGKDIERYTRLVTVYSEIFYVFRDVFWKLQIEKSFTDELRADYNRARARMDSLAREDDPKPSRRLTKTFQEEVNQEWPADVLRLS
jgi:hypothetical protein